MEDIKTFAIIQLTRMGDLIQTYQTCLDFKKQHPNIRLVLIARESFAKPLDFLLGSIFDNVITIDHSLYLQSENKNVDKYLEIGKMTLDDINKENIDVVINFSFCQASNYLSSCIETKSRLGTYIDDNNNVVVYDQWSQVIHTMIQRGAYCPYNLVDLFKNILGITPQITNIDVSDKKREKILAIHPFTSSAKKCWPIKKWTEVIYSFLKDNPEYKVYIFGSEKEKNKAEIFKSESILLKYNQRIYSLVGKLTVEQSFNQLLSCSYFIGHDSMVGHLAKVANIPSLTLSLGTVREVETIPYGENSYILSPRTNCYPCFPDTSCSNFQCHNDISYQATSTILNAFVKKGAIDSSDIKNLVSPFHMNSLNVYKGSFATSGWLYLKNLSVNEPQIKSLIQMFLRVSFSFKLEDKEEMFPLPRLNHTTHNRLVLISDGVRQLFELCEFGKKYSRYILSELTKPNPSVDFIKEQSQKIEEIDKLMDLIKQTYSELSPVIEYYQVTKSNLFGKSLVQITESSYLVYDDNAVLCSLMFELIEASIKNYEDTQRPNQLLKKGEL
jgi:ADP-heptose:LPS heptosyltransferase